MTSSTATSRGITRTMCRIDGPRRKKRKASKQIELMLYGISLLVLFVPVLWEAIYTFSKEGGVISQVRSESSFAWVYYVGYVVIWCGARTTWPSIRYFSTVSFVVMVVVPLVSVLAVLLVLSLFVFPLWRW